MVKEEGNEEVESVSAEKKLTDIPGIGPGIAAKLEAAGVYDLMGLAVMSPSALSELAGVGELERKAATAAALFRLKVFLLDFLYNAARRRISNRSRQ
jgi:predicted RecB family nuclease